nr:immunoglobulin heavy chain junction region [Mus musculus]
CARGGNYYGSNSYWCFDVW